ncbi:MAG: tetratricopeptide repeat protein, partial [Bacteroidia bacterium]|nr:tetratricopeptide repeat protein [Bacteroidia bacterium]
MSLLEDNEPIGPILGKYLVEYLSRHPKLIPTSEKISVSILVIGLVLNFFKIENTGFVLITGSVLTALTYFLSAFQSVETGELKTTGILNSTGFINFIYKLSFFALSLTAIATIGFVFKTFPFIKMLTTISIISLSIVLIISIITKINDRSKIYNSVFYIRIVPAILLLYFLFTFHQNSREKVTQYYNSGIAKYENWDFDGALEDFNNEIKINPGNSKAYYYKGKINPSESGSLADFSKAIEINPDFAEAYYERGIFRLHLGDFAEAYKDLTKAESYPGFSFPYSSETKYYHLADDWKTISRYNAQIKINPRNAEAYFMRGSSKHQISDNSGAMEDLNKAIEIDPDY